MKPKTVRLVAVLAAVATSVSLAAGPAGAQTAPAPAKGLGALLGSLLGQPTGGAPGAPVVPKPAPAVAAAPVTPPPGAATPLAVEQQLAGLRYFVGAVDGVVDNDTASGIMAFQKVHGLPRTGELTGDVGPQIMAASGLPAPVVPNSDANKVEVDLTRQVLFLYEGGSISNIIPISSGKASTPTPTGSFKVIRRAKGWETSDLGQLYNSQYFVGGYAIHGSPSVPNYPASHGCIRLPMSVAEWFPDHVTLGTPVYVLGG
jgi:lipoprotein-anchoring transpeptidase ErfK/SrfK